MILPKILIYKERFSLDEFHMYEEGFNKDLFEVLLQCKDVLSLAYSDMEGQYLSIFNAAYYICADAIRSKLPFLKIKEYRDYVFWQTHAGSRKTDAVLCMVSVILSDYPSPEKTDTKLMEAIRNAVDNTFYADFTRLWHTSSSNCHTRVWERYTVKPDAFTEDFFIKNHDNLKWKKWTNDYSEREVREIVNNAGDLKEEKLNLMDAIIEDAKANGRTNVDKMFSHFYINLECGMKDTPFGFVYRKKKDLPAEPAPALQQEDTSTQRIQELEAEIASLKARMKELEEENRRKDENMARMKRQMSEHAQKANNDFTFDKSVGTVVAHADNITIKYT